MADKQNITIQLAGQPKIKLAAERSDEEIVRKAEKMVNDLWQLWVTQNFAAEPQLKVMARVAFQFAFLYLRQGRDLEEIEKLDESLDQLIKNLPGLEQG